MNTVKNRLCEDIARFFKIDKSIVQENTHTNFFNYPYNASSEEILYIYFHLKGNYSINLDSSKIKEGAFESIDKICELLV